MKDPATFRKYVVKRRNARGRYLRRPEKMLYTLAPHAATIVSRNLLAPSTPFLPCLQERFPLIISKTLNRQLNDVILFRVLASLQCWQLIRCNWKQLTSYWLGTMTYRTKSRAGYYGPLANEFVSWIYPVHIFTIPKLNSGHGSKLVSRYCRPVDYSEQDHTPRPIHMQPEKRHVQSIAISTF